MKQENQKGKHKILIGIGFILAVICLIVTLVVRLKSGKLTEIDAELARAMTYDQFGEGEEIVDGTNRCLEFSAFFLRDLDGDGYAEKIKGTCKKVGERDTLYLEINVLTEGKLKDAVIEINSENFYYYTAIVKDNQVKNSCIDVNTKKIEFNTMENGTQKFLLGEIRTGDYSQKTKMLDAIGDDTTKYSKENQIVLTGTYVTKEGKEVPIRKEINLTVDWYGEAECAIPEMYKDNIYNKNKTVYLGPNEPEDGIKLDFTVATQEIANELVLKKSYIEGTLPELNGYKPLAVKILGASGENVNCTYDAETGKYSAQRNAVIDETGKVVSKAFSTVWYSNIYNEYRFSIRYPKEAYSAIENYQSITIPITAYYEGYNNSNEEFQNPYKSNVVEDNITIFLEIEEYKGVNFEMTVGELKTKPIKRYAVSRVKPTNLYNNISEYEEQDYYKEAWEVISGREAQKSGIIMKDTRNLLPDESETQITDEFLKADQVTAEEMGDIVKYVGLYFVNSPKAFVGEDGWVKIYNDETNELLIEFTKDNWNGCIESKPYYYNEEISHIRVETSAPKIQSGLTVVHIKEINDEKLVEKYTREQFDEFKYIRGRLVGYSNYGMDGVDDIRYIETTSRTAVYENKMSIANVEVRPKAITTQATSNGQILINALKDEMNNQMGWINGTFLLKFPSEIIDLQVNNISINDRNVKIDNYETYEEEGNYYVKIYTSNTTGISYTIKIDCDMTADPTIFTVPTKVELYATNEAVQDYFDLGVDQYDVNNNGNVEEMVNYKTCDLDLVSPSSLLTSSIASDYDEDGTVAIAPRIAKIDKGQKEAKVSINFTNNYGGTVSDVVIVGKIPFKGNRYIINGKDLDSKFNTTMQSTGIEIPEELKEYARVYYTTNENATVDISDEQNRWVMAEEIEDWNLVKGYQVVLENFVMPQNNTYVMSYKINIPAGLGYNEVSYCTHAINFSLDTEEGKYRTRVESNKLGFMMAKQYDLELTKYQIATNKVVEGATYSITDKQTEESRTAITNQNGKLSIKGLYAEKQYEIREIKTPQEYELNEEKITISTSVDEENNLQVTTNGETRNVNTIKEGKDWKIVLEVEDEPKARLKIIKTDKVTGERLKGARFKITGKEKSNGLSITTNAQGEINLKGCYLGEEYTIEEIKANGYFLMKQPIKFIITREGGEYRFNLTNGEAHRTELSIQNEIPVLTLELQNEPRPTYQLEILKVEKNTTNSLVGAKFRIEGAGIDKAQNYVTNENGSLSIGGLYIGTDENESVEYTITETEAPQGYIKTSPIKLKVYKQGEELKLETITGEVKEANINGNLVSLIVEDEPIFKLQKKDGEEGSLLPNVKFALYAIGADSVETFATNTKGEVLGELETIKGETYRVLTTDANGQITADLAEGLYKVVELETLEKYDLPEEIEKRSYYFGVGNSRAGEIELYNNWLSTIEENNWVSVQNLIQTSDGGYLVNGYFYSSTMTLPNGKVLTNKGTVNCFIMKYNAEGEIQWADSIGGSGYDNNYNKIIETSDGAYILAGNTQNVSITLSNGEVITNKGDSDIVIVKYDSNGNILWNDSIGGDVNEFCQALTQTQDGGVIVGGKSNSAKIISSKTGKEIVKEKNTNDGIIIKYDKNGNIQSSKEFPFDIYGVVQAKNGEYLVEGFFNQTIILSNGETVTNQSNDIIIAKCDIQGNILWYDTISGSDKESNLYSISNGIISAKDGGYLVLGQFNSSNLTLSNGNQLFSARGYYQTFIVKYSEDGRIQWSNQIDGNNTYDVVSTKDGGFAVINKEAGLVKISKEGQKQWAKKDLGFNTYALEETMDGNYIIGGDFSGELTLPNGENLTHSGPPAGIMVKYNVTVYPKVENLIDANVTLSQVEYKPDYLEYIGNLGFDEGPLAIANTEDGGYVVSSRIMSSTVTLQNGTVLTNKGSNSRSSVLIRYNSEGDTEWGTIITGAGKDVNEYIYGVSGTSDNGFIAVGNYTSTDVLLDNGESIGTTGSSDGLVLKYDEQGNLEWYDTIQGSQEQTLIGVIQTDDKGYFVVGIVNGVTRLSNGESFSANADDVVILKYDKDGNIMYYKLVGDAGLDRLQLTSRVIEKTSDGGFIMGLRCVGNVKFDGRMIVQSTSNFPQGIVIKCSSEGNLEWYDLIKGEGGDAGTYGKTGVVGVQSVSQTSDGGYAITAINKSNLLLSNGDVVINNSGTNDSILIKYDSQGNIEWHREIRGTASNGLYGVKGLSNGEIIATGDYTGNSTGNIGEIILSDGSIRIPITNTKSGIFLVYDKNGNLKSYFEMQVSSSVSTNLIEETSDGGILIGGSTYFELTNNISVNSVKNPKVNSNRLDGFILKFDENIISPEKQGKLELEIENERKEYQIKTKVEPINNIKGGNISGETDYTYETVKYGDSNTKQIVMTPQENYEIIKVTVNGEEHKFTANADGTYTMPVLTDITEDIEVAVTYALSSNKIMIEKVDANDNDIKLEGAKIRLERIPDENDDTEYEVELETNSDGQAVTQAPYGTYHVTEVEAPEGYQINTSIADIEFRENGNHTFIIEDYQKPKVIVHHILKDREGNDTGTKVAEDEVYHGEKGESYTTAPQVGLTEYELEKDEQGNYVVPENAAGIFEEGEKVVTYYYQEKQIPLTVHYYIQGTQDKVPLSTNELAEDVIMQGYKGETYTTQELADVNEKYELVEVPENSNGTYGEEEIVVVYYYTLKKVNITTKVVQHEETDSLGQVSVVKGGSISGEGQDPYETVIYGENATKEIIATPEEGYQVKTIKINGEEIEFITNANGTVELSVFENLKEDKQIEVEFQKTIGTVIVHHYINGTTTKVPAKETGVVEDEIKTGFVGNIYATKVSENISDAYVFSSSSGETSGTYTSDEIVVIYYYRLREPKITMTKAVVTENNRKYVIPGETITYTVTVMNEGNLGKDVVIKDTIPTGTTFVEGSIQIDEEAKETMTAENLAQGITINVPMAEKDVVSTRKVSFEVRVNENATGEIANVATVDEVATNEVKIPMLHYESSIEKTTRQEKITSKDTVVYYEIEYDANINYFEGKAIVTIVDTLPYPINQEESNLDGGIYDADKHTITWTQEINNIDTFASVEANKVKMMKTITLSYEYGNLDGTTGSMKNKVEGTIQLQAPNKTNPSIYEKVGEDTANAEEENLIEIPAEVRVHHYIYDSELGVNTTTKLVDDEVIEGIIGQTYTTSKSSKILANYTCVNEQPENYTGKMKEAPIDVNYYYQLMTPTVENATQKIATANKRDENAVAVLTREDSVVIYNITYDVNIKDYIGKATVEIVDALPARIDIDKSNLAGGSYNEATRTITWVEEIDNIDTFTNGNYTKRITKQIMVVYDGQNVLSNLENTVTGKIKTYYPEDYLTKGGKEFIEKEAVTTAVTKQEYKVDIKVSKVWEDTDNLKGKRPESVTIRIMPSNGTAITTELKEENNWTYEVKGLPKYDEATGRKISYNVIESETTVGDLEYYENAVIATEETQTDEVTKYQTTVTNTYKLTNTDLHTQLTKIGTDEITSRNDEVVYTINLKSEIGDYIGGGKVLMVDTLPYKIDVTKSSLDNGVYDEEKKTITFEEELPHINTGNAGENYQINITKQIKVVYQDVNLEENKITNVVNGKVQLYETDQKDEATASFDTNINVQGKVIVKYIDKIHQKEIANSYEIVGKVGDPYITEKKQIEDYNYIESTNNETGKIKEENQEVIYYYEPLETSVIVKYQDRTGKAIAESVLIEGYMGDSYKTEKKEMENYRLVEVKGQEEGTMTKNPIEVIYIYEKIPAKVMVKYLTKQTEKTEAGEETKEIELLPSEIIEGFVGDSYEVARKAIPNYKAAEPEPTNASGKMTEKTIEVIYYYERIPSGIVNVKYVDLETEKEITHGENNEVYGYQISGFVGDKYEAKQLEIPYYTFVKSTDNKEGILTEVGDTILYYYRKLDFNVSLDKTISNITLNGNTVRVLDEKLAKVEIKAKDVKNTELIMKYNIKVTNKGELAGTAKVLEKIPSECKVVESPAYWKVRTDGMLESDVELNVGESKDLSVTLKWINSENNLGSKSNTAQIISTANVANYGDSNKQDDISSATVIISVSTGQWIKGIMMATLVMSFVICLLIMTSLMHNIKREPDIKKTRLK